nr:MAG TPA: hypothetical protein [Caudoviricetes sp.]
MICSRTLWTLAKLTAYVMHYVIPSKPTKVASPEASVTTWIQWPKLPIFEKWRYL